MDALLTHTVQLCGPIFKSHNQLFFDNLKKLTIGGDCWQFIQHLKAPSDRNGWAAFLLLQQQAKGTEARKSCVQSACDAICNTIYTGKRISPLRLM